MNSPLPGADGAAGLLTMRETREIFHFGERDLRLAISLKRLPITVVDNRIMISPADAELLASSNGVGVMASDLGEDAPCGPADPAPKPRNRITEAFSWRTVAMQKSAPYRVLNGSELKMLDRIEIELASHAGKDNGSLPVTFDDFVEYANPARTDSAITPRPCRPRIRYLHSGGCCGRFR